jgi:hypothetical protein
MEGKGSRLRRIIYSQTYHPLKYILLHTQYGTRDFNHFVLYYLPGLPKSKSGRISLTLTHKRKKENKKEPENIFRYRQSTSTHPKIYGCRPTRYLMAIYLDDIPPVLNLPVDVKYSGETKERKHQIQLVSDLNILTLLVASARQPARQPA